MKYARDMPLGLGFSMANLTDPCVASHIAQGWLAGLRDLNVIPRSPSVPSSTTTSATISTTPTAVPSTPMSTVVASPLSSTSPPSSVSLSATSEVTDAWDINHPALAFPGMTYDRLLCVVRHSIVSGGVEKARGQAKRFGLGHKQVLAELESIASGELKASLKTAIDWKPGMRVSSYWFNFQQLYPFLSEGFFLSFGAVSLTTTCVEASFSVANNLVDPSMASETINDVMFYQTQVRSNLVGDMKAVVHHKDGTESKLMNGFSTQAGRMEYNKQLDVIIKELEGFAATQGTLRVTARDLAVQRGHLADLKTKQPLMEAELNETLRKRKPSASGLLHEDEVSALRDKLSSAKLKGEVTQSESSVQNEKRNVCSAIDEVR